MVVSQKEQEARVQCNVTLNKDEIRDVGLDSLEWRHGNQSSSLFLISPREVRAVTWATCVNVTYTDDQGVSGLACQPRTKSDRPDTDSQAVLDSETPIVWVMEVSGTTSRTGTFRGRPRSS